MCLFRIAALAKLVRRSTYVILNFSVKLKTNYRGIVRGGLQLHKILSNLCTDT